MEKNENLQYDTFDAAVARSAAIDADIDTNPGKYRVLTGDRPTGLLHIGHLFGSLLNRVRLQQRGVETFIVIADYQVLTDRETFKNIAVHTKELVIDYLAAGLDPESGRTFIFPHSYVPELNQLLVPFLTLVSNAELQRNPTVKEEIEASGMEKINAGMFAYPIHQAADILFCKGNVVPVGKDQLPHLEATRTVARRFNKRYAAGKPLFAEPSALLSSTPLILGTDGSAKMSKSRGNAILISATEEETAKIIKKAKTDGSREITYDPEGRPEVSNLLTVIALAEGNNPEKVAEEIGDGGAAKLKARLTDSLNAYLAPIRKKRREIEEDPAYIREVLHKGIGRARNEAEKTLAEVREAMNMTF